MTTYKVSTIPAAKRNLVAALVAATWPASTPQISYGEPKKGREREAVIVGDTARTGESGQQWAALAGSGQRPRDELYALDLVVDVSTPGDSCQEATERAFALFAVVEQTLRANPTLGVAPTSPEQGQVYVAAIRQPVHTETTTDEGYRTVIESAVAVQARI